MSVIDQALDFVKTGLHPPGQQTPSQKFDKRFWQSFERFKASPDIRQHLGQYKPENELESGYTPATLHAMYGQYLKEPVAGSSVGGA